MVNPTWVRSSEAPEVNYYLSLAAADLVCNSTIKVKLYIYSNLVHL